MDEDIPFFPLMTITIGVLLLIGAAYYAKIKTRQLFSGFRGLKTKRSIERLIGWARPAPGQHRLKSTDISPSKKRAAEALLSAAEDGRLEDVKLLVHKGTDVNVESPVAGRSPLMRAAANGHVDVVSFLLHRGARINQKSKYSGKTALMRAAQFGHARVVKLLVYNGADINLHSVASGKTALMRACRNGHYEVARLLLERGAQATVKDKSGKSALDYCVEADFKDLVTLLRTRTAASPHQEGETSSKS